MLSASPRLSTQAVGLVQLIMTRNDEEEGDGEGEGYKLVGRMGWRSDLGTIAQSCCCVGLRYMVSIVLTLRFLASYDSYDMDTKMNVCFDERWSSTAIYIPPLAQLGLPHSARPWSENSSHGSDSDATTQCQLERVGACS